MNIHKTFLFIILTFISFLFTASYSAHAIDALQRELTNLQNSLRQLNQSLSQLQEEQLPAQRGPIQQQAMEKSLVIKELGIGKKEINKVVLLFQKDVADHESENTKIPQKTADKFRIMSYNVHFWTDPKQKRNHDAMWQVIDNINPDVLVLQEATTPQAFDQNPDRNSKMVKTLTAKGYKYLATCNTMRGQFFGNIVASKIPTSRLHREAFKAQERPGQEDRCFSYMALTLPNGKDLHIYGTHLEVGKTSTRAKVDKIRDQQITQISDFIERNFATENVLIIGDFNATRASNAVRNLIGQNFQDSFAALNWQHPQFTSMYGSEIDFMFLNPGWNLSLGGAYVYWSAASDHLPIIMDINLN